MTIFREEGPSALYKGFLPKVLRLAPGGGVLLLVVEFTLGVFRKGSLLFSCVSPLDELTRLPHSSGATIHLIGGIERLLIEVILLLGAYTVYRPRILFLHKQNN